MLGLVFAHFIADVIRDVGAPAIAVPGIALDWVMDATRKQFMPPVGT
jgi:hypothetical protein